MSQRDQLFENIEDAFMSLFMADVAEYEGQKFIEENERLKSDTNFKLPSELDRRCIRTINKTERKKRARSTGKRIYRVFSKLSVAAIIALALFTSAYAAFPAVRVSTLNLLIQVSDIATEFTFSDDSIIDDEANVVETPSNSELDDNFTVSGYLLPDLITSNYHMTDEGSDPAGSWVSFKGADDTLITFEVQHGEGNSLNINTEDEVRSQKVSVNQFQCLVSQRQNNTIIAGVIDTRKINYTLIVFEGVEYESAITILKAFMSIN